MRRPTPWFLAIASGGALALALPGPGLGPLVLLFPGLLLEALERGEGRWRAAALGWLAGAVCWAATVDWVVPVMDGYGGLPLALALLCLLLMALYLGLTWAAAAWLTALAPRQARVLALPLAFTALEAMRQLPPYRFPWNPTAATVSAWPALLGSLPVWGASGLGWALVALGAALWGLARQGTRRLALVAGCVALGMTALCTALAPPPRPAGEPREVAVIQPDTSLEESWDAGHAADLVDRVWRLTGEATADGAELVVWPESAVPAVLDADPAFRRAVVALADRLGVTIVVNSIGTTGGRYTNSAYVVTGAGVLEPRYDKIRLVPFGEYVPAIARFAFAESLVREVGAFSPGRDPRPLPTEPPLGMLICYEVVFPDLVAAEVRRGAEGLLTLTNDGWYGYSSAPPQHFAQAVLRAAESRRWLGRAALTGISGFVDPYGRVPQRLEVGASGVLVERVTPCSGITLRVRLGDWWGVLSAVGLAGLLVAGGLGRRQTRPGQAGAWGL